MIVNPRVFWFVLALVATRAPCQTFPTSEIMVQGPRDSRINLVIISEGYTSEELATFKIQAQDVSAGFFEQKPFSDYRTFFNVFTLEVPSLQSGCDHPNNAIDESPGLPAFSAQTYFNASFDVAGIHRLLVAEDSRAYEVLRDSFPDWDVALFLINHEWYGGSGGGIAAISRHTAAVELALHELGHSFAYLADEYGGQGGSQVVEGINVTAKTLRQEIRWNAWIEPSTPIPTPATAAFANVIGLFEGANYHDRGWYRPHLSCKMRDLGSPFCAVCQEGTILAIYGLLPPIISVSPSVEDVILTGNATQVFEVTRAIPVTDTHQVTWTLDGVTLSEENASMPIVAADLTPGLHELEVQVRDTTALVRNDPHAKLVANHTWRITRAHELPQLTRWLPHISRDGGGFQTTLYLRSVMEEAATIRLYPFDQEGQALTSRDVNLNAGELRLLESAVLFGGEAVSHVGVDAPDQVLVTASYRATDNRGASAHLPASTQACSSATFYPGEWDWVFDGLALINVGETATDIWVHQYSHAGALLASKNLTTEALLPPNAKLLSVLGESFDAVFGSFFQVEATQPFHWVALRGTPPGIFPSYLFQILPDTCQ